MSAPDRPGRKGADILLDVLESEGCEYVFGNPGTTELPLIDALVDRPGLHYVLGLQEASVVAMADGYAQASGKPGFVNLHTAGGLGHGLGNLLNAYTSGTPLVVTAGQGLAPCHHRSAAAGRPGLDRTPSLQVGGRDHSPDQIAILTHRAFQDCQATPADRSSCPRRWTSWKPAAPCRSRAVRTSIGARSRARCRNWPRS